MKLQDRYGKLYNINTSQDIITDVKCIQVIMGEHGGVDLWWRGGSFLDVRYHFTDIDYIGYLEGIYHRPPGPWRLIESKEGNSQAIYQQIKEWMK
jgi:hypothetical protein